MSEEWAILCERERAFWRLFKKESKGIQPTRGKAPQGAWKQLFKRVKPTKKLT